MLLGLLALAAVGRADEAAAVKAIEKMGGRVTRDAKQPGKPVVKVDLHFCTEVTDAGLKELNNPTINWAHLYYGWTGTINLLDTFDWGTSVTTPYHWYIKKL